MSYARGIEYEINFFGKIKPAIYYGSNEEGIHLFILKRKFKRPDGKFTNYFFCKLDNDGNIVLPKLKEN